MSNMLDTGIKNCRNVLRYIFGRGSVDSLRDILAQRRNEPDSQVIFFVDEYFSSHGSLADRLPVESGDRMVFVSTSEEPTTDYVNRLYLELKAEGLRPCAMVGVGGGTTMDVAKAVSNLWTNGGRAEDYQGWDLVRSPGVFKVAVPTISGTGAEATRTCVMTNKKTGLKLGMNSDFTVYDQLILDPDLTSTVLRNQYFYTGMDAYIHCVEALGGAYRNAVGDAYSDQTIRLCRDVFLSDDMMQEDNREKLMVASYLGGCAIATSYVGLIHPFSAGLSVVLGLHHCVANCIVMRGMEAFYPEAYREFMGMVEKQEVDIPSGICTGLSEAQFGQLYDATIIHEKPLTNALGEGFRDVLTRDKVREIFMRM